MDTEQLNQIALANMGHRKTHKGREPGYIYHHGRRTAQIALRLASQVSGPVDRDILRAAALFHDVGKGVEPHNESGARIARELLSELCEPEEVDGICEIILQHSQRQHPNDYTLETRIVQDADILDHVGPLGPWLQFYWSATHDETIDDALRFFHGRGEGHRAVMRRLLNLAVSVLIFDQRIEFEDRFFAEFERVHREGHRGEGNMPETTAAAIVTAGDSKEPKVLLTRRNHEPFEGHWCIPGGHIDQFEPVRDGVTREIREETGLDFDPLFFGYFDEIIPERGIHYVVMVFVGQGRGTLIPQEDEVSEARWFSLDEARSLPLAFTHNEVLDAYASSLSAR